MALAYGLFGLALACIAWNVVASILICRALNRRGVKVHYVFIKALIPWYAHRYKRITEKETGRAGMLFYHWVISINAALILGVASLIALKS